MNILYYLVCCIYRKDCDSDTDSSCSDQEYNGKNIGKPNDYEKMKSIAFLLLFLEYKS